MLLCSATVIRRKGYQLGQSGSGGFSFPEQAKFEQEDWNTNYNGPAEAFVLRSDFYQEPLLSTSQLHSKVPVPKIQTIKPKISNGDYTEELTKKNVQRSCASSRILDKDEISSNSNTNVEDEYRRFIFDKTESFMLGFIENMLANYIYDQYKTYTTSISTNTTNKNDGLAFLG